MKTILLNNKFYIENDVFIGINKATKCETHTHDFIEFVYMLSGKSVHNVDDNVYPLNSGDLLIINYNQTHSFSGEENAILCNILIKPSFIDESLIESKDLFLLFETPHYKEFKELIDNKCNFIRFSPEEKNCFAYMVLLLDEEMKNKRIGFDSIIDNGVNFLLTMIFRKMCSSPKNQNHEFKKIFEFLENHYYENISASILAEMCHYNPSYFSRLFKKYTGITFSEYLKKIRIRNACRLLENKNIKINDLYTKVGYTNKTNFYKHFREITNMTPYEYKKVKK